MSVTKHYSKGDVIFKEKTVEYALYEIISGSVDIVSSYGEPDEKKLVTLGAGKIFGELGLIDYVPRTASAIASEDVDVLYVEDDDFEKYLEEKPERIFRVLSSTTSRINDLSNDFDAVKKDIVDYYNTDASLRPKKLTDRIKATLKFWDSFYASHPEYLTYYDHI